MFNAKCYLMWSFLFLMIAQYNMFLIDNMFIRSIFSIVLLFIIIMNQFVTKEIAEKGGFLKENLFNVWL